MASRRRYSRFEEPALAFLEVSRVAFFVRGADKTSAGWLFVATTDSDHPVVGDKQGGRGDEPPLRPEVTGPTTPRTDGSRPQPPRLAWRRWSAQKALLLGAPLVHCPT
jgi:hypothetical protein